MCVIQASDEEQVAGSAEEDEGPSLKTKRRAVAVEDDDD